MIKISISNGTVKLIHSIESICQSVCLRYGLSVAPLFYFRLLSVGHRVLAHVRRQKERTEHSEPVNLSAG